MSWIIGVVGKNKSKYCDVLSKLVGLSKLVDNSFTTIFGGGSNICFFYDYYSEVNTHFILNGLGIVEKNGKPIIADIRDWTNFASRDKQFHIDGHYILTICEPNRLQIFTDKLGLRELYFTNLNDDCILFSSRIDWLLNIKNSSIDYSLLGTRWLLTNSLSDKLPFSGVEKLNKGYTFQYDADYGTIQKIKQDSIATNSDKNFELTLRDFVNIELQNSIQRSFLLSGGLDSRLLLSLLSDRNLKSADFYTFGNDSSPDEVISNKIAKRLNLNHKIISTEICQPEVFLSEFEDYSSQTLANNPLTSFASSSRIKCIPKYGFLIDGGFGEIWRNGFARKLFYFGKKAVQNIDVDIIFKYLKYSRGNFLSNDLKAELYKGCLLEIQKYFEENPYRMNMGYKKYIADFSLSNRLPNYYAPEQSYNDSVLPGFMPFAQYSLLSSLDYLYNQNISFKKTIRNNNNKLAKFPLAKNNDLISFRFSNIHILIEKYKSFVFKTNKNNDLAFLDSLIPNIKQE